MLMKFKKVMIPVALLILLFIISGCSNKDEDYRVSNTNRIILRLAETQSPSYPSSQGAKEFARLVEQKSGGRIKVKVYDYGKLGDEASVIEQVQFGGIDLARVGLASLARYSPKVNIVTLPYIFRSSDHMWKAIHGSLGEDIKESLLKEKITCLAWYEGGAKSFYNSQRQINSIDDLKGLKISVQQSQLNMNLYSYIGASLVPTRPSDIYNVLQAGNIDGGEDNIITYYTLKHYEVAPYLTYDEHARIPEVIIGSRVTMLQLSKNDQAIIAQAAKESALMQRHVWFAMEKEVLRALNGKGINIVYANFNSKESFLSLAKPFYAGFKSEELDAVAGY